MKLRALPVLCLLALAPGTALASSTPPAEVVATSPGKPDPVQPPHTAVGSSTSVTYTRAVCRGPWAFAPHAAMGPTEIPTRPGQYRLRRGPDGWYGFRDRLAITRTNGKVSSVVALPGRWCGPAARPVR